MCAGSVLSCTIEWTTSTKSSGVRISNLHHTRALSGVPSWGTSGAGLCATASLQLLVQRSLHCSHFWHSAEAQADSIAPQAEFRQLMQQTAPM